MSCNRRFWFPHLSLTDLQGNIDLQCKACLNVTLLGKENLGAILRQYKEITIPLFKAHFWEEGKTTQQMMSWEPVGWLRGRMTGMMDVRGKGGSHNWWPHFFFNSLVLNLFTPTVTSSAKFRCVFYGASSHLVFRKLQSHWESTRFRTDVTWSRDGRKLTFLFHAQSMKPEALC